MKFTFHILNILFQGSFYLAFFISTSFSQVNPNPYNKIENLQSIPQDKYTFSILGDRTGSGPDSWSILDKAIFEMNQLQPDFVIMIGDLIEDNSSDRHTIESKWNEALQHISAFRVPFFMVPGNHDIWNQTSYRIWKEMMGDTYFSFDYQNDHFLILNTEEKYGTAEEGFGSQQMNFIMNDIRNHQKADPFFIFLHQPVWLLSGQLKNDWNKIESSLQDVSYSVFSGHLHVLASKYIDEHPYTIVGPTGGEMRLPRNPALGLFHHYTWVTVTGSRFSVAFIEPGRIYSEETALKVYDIYLQGMNLLMDQ
ncbi:hypothetical protein EH221_09965 [bacterium]|nr:MAG: hypothetical protein EH221_09965 [bacterium]